MRLNELENELSPKKNSKRVGRGIGCGKGKTCGRGYKGQTSRAGASVNGFEGGQMPIYRRLPKRGFVNIFKDEFQVVNLGDLQKFIDSGKLDAKKTVDKEALYNAGLIKKLHLSVKILGNGELKSSVQLDVDAASASVRSAIEALGGKVTVRNSVQEVAA